MTVPMAEVLGLTQLLLPDPSDDDLVFGDAVALWENTAGDRLVFVGCHPPYDEKRSSAADGTVYVFHQSQGSDSWTFLKKLVTPDGPSALNSDFGCALAVYDNVLAVAGPCEHANGFNLQTVPAETTWVALYDVAAMLPTHPSQDFAPLEKLSLPGSDTFHWLARSGVNMVVSLGAETVALCNPGSKKALVWRIENGDWVHVGAIDHRDVSNPLHSVIAEDAHFPASVAVARPDPLGAELVICSGPRQGTGSGKVERALAVFDADDLSVVRQLVPGPVDVNWGFSLAVGRHTGDVVSGGNGPSSKALTFRWRMNAYEWVKDATIDADANRGYALDLHEQADGGLPGGFRQWLVVRGDTGSAHPSVAQFVDYFAFVDGHTTAKLHPGTKTRITSFGRTKYSDPTVVPSNLNDPEIFFGVSVAVLPGLVAVGSRAQSGPGRGAVYLCDVPHFSFPGVF